MSAPIAPVPPDSGERFLTVSAVHNGAERLSRQVPLGGTHQPAPAGPIVHSEQDGRITALQVASQNVLLKPVEVGTFRAPVDNDKWLESRYLNAKTEDLLDVEGDPDPGAALP